MRPFIRWAIAGLAVVSPLAACTTIQALEPVTAPPASFRSDTLTSIEFMAPVAIGLRCAERGARVVGLPAFNSGACADASLITMLDPCLTLTAGPYARDLCTGRKAHGDWEASAISSLPKTAGPLRIEYKAPGREAPSDAKKPTESRIAVSFVAVGDLDRHCGDRLRKGSDNPLSCFNAGVMFAVNPCAVVDQGWYERLLCHELGHINGWSANHDGGFVRPPLRLASDSPEARALLLAAGPPPEEAAAFARNAP